MRGVTIIGFLCLTLALAKPAPLDRDHGFLSSLEKFTTHKFHNFVYCGLCKTVVSLAAEAIASDKTLEFLLPELEAMCRVEQFFQGLNGNITCPGFILNYGPVVTFVATTAYLEPTTTCQKLNFCEHPPSELEPVKIPETSPRRKRVTNDKPRHRNSKNITIVQLADIHVDPLYTEGAPTECGLVICCRKGYQGAGSAGKFGDYNCDVPWQTVDVILDHVTKLNAKPDFIFYAGDSPPHDIWEESWQSQLSVDYDVIKRLTSRLPGVKIYPTLGNHEMFPQSQYYLPKAEYQSFTKQTGTWWHEGFDLPADQLANTQRTAYYTTLLRPGLRLLSFNTNLWYTFNFYTLLNYLVPAVQEQMDFMEKTLENATWNDEKVIMLAHVAPGQFPDSNLQYGDFYTKLTAKYSDTIVLHTFGHNHRSGFEVMTYPASPPDPLAVMFLSPSVTTEGYVNPAYWVYTLDGETHELLECDQYHINITRANENGAAEVEHAFSMTKEYNIPDMTPHSFNTLVQRFKKSPELRRRYRDNIHAGSGYGLECGPLCTMFELCTVSSASTRETMRCLRERNMDFVH